MNMTIDTATTAPAPTVGATILHRGERGTVERVETEAYGETMLIIRFESRPGVAILRPREVGHPLAWTCPCAPCVTARRALGRAFS